MGFLRHLEVLPKARKAACNGSPCFGIKPRRLFLEELLPSRAPLRFVDGAKIRLVFVPTKFQLKKQPTFCPLGLFVSKTAYFLSITPDFPYVFPFDDAYVKTAYWVLIKILEIKYTYETENQQRNITIDAEGFVKAILKDALGDDPSIRIMRPLP